MTTTTLLHRGTVVSALALVMACGSDDGGSSAAPAPNVLVKGSPSPADTTCPGGGTKIDVGADKNGNGQLDADEITGSQIVCNPGAAPTLTTVTPEGPTTKCTNGGTVVKSGVDSNVNGKLDDSEVTSTEEICAGGTSNELSKSTAIPAGDVSCPFGGVRTQSGKDNGANGGVAGDGVLQDGEILLTTTACVSGAPFAGTTVPPAGPAGTSTIRASGGAGTVGGGDVGGTVAAVFIGGAAGSGGSIALFKTGKVDASFTPSTFTPTFGATKLEVAANKTIAGYASSANAADGEYYVITGSPGLWFRESAANQQPPVTGVHIAPNVTLTFPKEGAALQLSADFHNEGTLTTATDPATGSRGGIIITARQFGGAAGSKVVLTGAAVAGQPGGNGGSFNLQAVRILNNGEIDTSGAAGDTGMVGGAGGPVQLRATLVTSAGPVEHVGPITTRGGAGKGTGRGGTGGTVLISANAHSVRVKGNIDSSGGANGGNAGGVSLVGAGDIVYAGNVSARGADVEEATCGATCAGGSASLVLLTTQGGSLRWDGDVLTTGGKSKGTAGGNGATVNMRLFDWTDPVLSVTVPAGSILRSGSADASGGAGSVGGSSGNYLSVVNSSLPAPREILWLGLQSVEANGGAGATSGGPGGSLIFSQHTGGTALDAQGAVLLHSTLSNRGGSGATASGGSGGTYQLQTGLGAAGATSSQALVIAGAIDNSGGAGATVGGAGGAIVASSRERIDILAPITSNGGASSATNGAGGATGALSVTAGTELAVTAPISCKGGSSTGATSTGGSGTPTQLRAAAVTASGVISIAGGNGNGAAGGNGGALTITSSTALTKIAGVTAPFGKGTPNGTAGVITIDGIVR